MTGSRSNYLDNMKGFLIILVVFAHFLYDFKAVGAVGPVVTTIYTFHMPAFIFISGYLSKSRHAQSRENLLKFAAAYFLFNGIFILIATVKYSSVNILTPYYSMWYLLSIVTWRLLIPYIPANRRTLAVSVLLALLAGFFPDVENILSIRRTVAFFPFFLSGYLTDESALNRLRDIAKPKKALIALAGFPGFILLALLYDSRCHFSSASLLMEHYSGLSDLFARVFLFILASLAIVLMLYIFPAVRVPFLSKAGKNSLTIYLLHRYVTLIYADVIRRFFPGKVTVGMLFLSSAVLTVMLILLFGSDTVSDRVNHFLSDITTMSEAKHDKINLQKCICTAAVVCILLFPVVKSVCVSLAAAPATPAQAPADSSEAAQDILYPVLSGQQQSAYDNAFRLLFSGDLILLEDQVKRAYNGEGYDFHELFEYTSRYISSADLAIGVLEGPLGGEEIGFSTSNYDDGKTLALNYPDEFAAAIGDAGFDILTAANNHLLDKGYDAACRTLDVLDALELRHIGAYRDAAEKERSRVLLYEKDGIRFAVLAYTYGCNGYQTDELIDGAYSSLTSYLVSPSDARFEEVRASVQADFDKAKSYAPDIIIVLPHMGEQFTDAPNEYQLTWCQVFRELGADIILGDHSHSVQPMEFDTVNGKTVFTAYCPGNYANIYREHYGDAGALVEVYIDRDSKQIIGSSIIPMWTSATLDGNYRPIPVGAAADDQSLRAMLSTDDLLRIERVNRHITAAMLGNELGADMLRNRYYFTSAGFCRTAAEPLVLTDELRSGALYPLLTRADAVCFLGDSVTEGTKNGGFPWYEPLSGCISGAVFNESAGGATVKTLLERIQTRGIAKADLYVIAIGTNDVRYRNPDNCAMTEEEYRSDLDRLASFILESSPEAEFVFIAPWTSIDGDPYTGLSYSEKTALNQRYTQSLEAYCKENGYGFVNANPYIERALAHTPSSFYLIDHIHPNSTNGIRLYAEAALAYQA